MSRDGVTLVVGVRTAVDGLRKSQNSASSNLPNRDNLFISVNILCEAQPAASDIQVSATPPRDTAAARLRPSLVSQLAAVPAAAPDMRKNDKMPDSPIVSHACSVVGPLS